MHDTTVKLKDGRVLSGPIDMWRPWENWLSLMGVKEHISFDDIASGKTDEDGKDTDVMEKARMDVAEGRRHGWEGYPQELFKWE